MLSPSRTSVSPRMTGLSPLTARSSVDLPEPDRPISTMTSPGMMSKVAPATPKVWPVWSWISRRVLPASISGNARCGFEPKTMSTLRKETIGSLISGLPSDD